MNDRFDKLEQDIANISKVLEDGVEVTSDGEETLRPSFDYEKIEEDVTQIKDMSCKRSYRRQHCGRRSRRGKCGTLGGSGDRSSRRSPRRGDGRTACTACARRGTDSYGCTA